MEAPPRMIALDKAAMQGGRVCSLSLGPSLRIAIGR